MSTARMLTTAADMPSWFDSRPLHSKTMRRKPAAIVSLGNVRYPVEFLPPGHKLLRLSATHNGCPCEGQTFYKDVENGPRIVIEKGLEAKAELGAIVHEGFHAMAPEVFSEAWVEAREQEFTEYLWQLGYRRVSI